MVSKKEVAKQLKKINFNHKGWGKGEISELPNIILPGEEIYECVNGMYEGGFALLLATDIRVLLVDKKPLNFLTVEDMRFDMISQMDYNHRLFGAEIGISAGDKNLRFRSYNKERLRKLIGHVQHCMAEIKKKQSFHQDTQVSHLEQINQQLQAYLAAQHKYQLELQQMNAKQTSNSDAKLPEPPKPNNELADYLYAQSLLDEHTKQLDKESKEPEPDTTKEESQAAPIETNTDVPNEVLTQASENQLRNRPDEVSQNTDLEEIYSEGMKEVFGSQVSDSGVSMNGNLENMGIIYEAPSKHLLLKGFEINPMHIAYSKLPIALRNRKFSSPSLRQRHPRRGVDASPSHA